MENLLRGFHLVAPARRRRPPGRSWNLSFLSPLPGRLRLSGWTSLFDALTGAMDTKANGSGNARRANSDPVAWAESCIIAVLISVKYDVRKRSFRDIAHIKMISWTG